MSLRSTNPIRITSGQAYDPSASLTDQMARRLLSPNSIGITQTNIGVGPDIQPWDQHSPQSYFVTRAGRPQRIEDMPRAGNGPQARPQFRSKVVCVLDCKHCGTEVCKRGMKAILLADINVELFSTDSPPFGVQLVNDDYRTRNCFCRIRDVACLGCGNVIGYHVTQPCEPCMDACNNGHFWMFHCTEVSSKDRTNATGNVLVWSQIPRADKDMIKSQAGPSMLR